MRALIEPTQEADSVEVTVAASGYPSRQGDETVRVDDLGPPMRLTVRTGSSLGASHTVTFTR